MTVARNVLWSSDAGVARICVYRRARNCYIVIVRSGTISKISKGDISTTMLR